LSPGSCQPRRYPLVPAIEIARFLEAAGIAAGAASTGPERSAGEIASAASPALVAIECAR
jgi:hypothetical protein